MEYNIFPALVNGIVDGINFLCDFNHTTVHVSHQFAPIHQPIGVFSKEPLKVHSSKFLKSAT